MHPDLSSTSGNACLPTYAAQVEAASYCLQLSTQDNPSTSQFGSSSLYVLVTFAQGMLE